MKNIIAFLLMISLVVCATDCTTDLSETSHTDIQQPPLKKVSVMQEAFPDKKKELIQLSNGSIIEKMDSFYIFQGDIILTNEQINKFNIHSKSAISTSAVKYWPNHTVYYSFAPGFTKRNLVQQAISHWEQNTCLRFSQKTNTIKNYIEFFNGTGNYSHLGMTGGKQQISIDRDENTVGTAIHEIGHAIGLFHEQCRSDRDNFIMIHWENIVDKKEHNFQKFTDRGEAGANIGTFDFNSIMLYNSFAFSKNNNPTMTRRDGSTFIPPSRALSSGDLEGIKAIYGPPFYKLERKERVLEQWVSGNNERYVSETNNTIYFYTDETYQSKTSLPYSRKICYSYTICEGQPGNYVLTKNEEIMVPAGVSSYTLGTTQTEEEYTAGVPNRYHKEEYVIY